MTERQGSQPEEPERVSPAGEPEDIYETDEPGKGEVLRAKKVYRPHPDTVRMGLAGAMVAILAVIVVTACWKWLHGATVDDMQALAVVMSPVVTLVGTILGFYFSSERKKSE